MFLDMVTKNIVTFRRTMIVGTIIFMIVVSSFFSGEWNNWLAAIFLILTFPLVFFSLLLQREAPPVASSERWWRSPYFFVFAFVGAALLSVFFSVMKYSSLHYWALLVGYVIVFWVVSRTITSFQNVKLITLVIFCTGVLASMINLFLFLKDSATRAGGALLNANALGSYFLFSLPIGICLTLAARHSKQRWLFGAGTFLVAISFLLTFSYTGWVSFFAPCMIGIIFFRERLLNKKNILLFVICVVSLIILLIGIRYFSNHDIKQSLELYKTISSSNFIISFTQRWHFIQSTVHIFGDHPWFGTGLATFQHVYTRYAVTLIEQPRYAHNYYLQTAAETGIIGFIALLGFVLTLLIRAWRTIKQTVSDESRRAYYIGLGLGILGSAIHSLFDFGWQFPAVFLLFWVCSGMLVGAPLSIDSKQEGMTTINQRRPGNVLMVALIGISLVLLVRGVTLFISQSYFDRAVIKDTEGKFGEALSLYSKSTRLDPAPDKLRPYAYAYFQRGVEQKSERQIDYDQADRIFQANTRWNPNDYFSYDRAGQMYFLRKEYDRAEQQYRLAIAYDPFFHPDFHYDLAFLYFSQQKYDLVKQTIDAVLNAYADIKSSSNPNLSIQLSYLNVLLGRSYKDQGDSEQARRYFQAALDLQPNFGLAKSELEQLAN